MALMTTARQYIAEPEPALDFVRTSLDERTWHPTTKWYQIDMAFSPIYTVGGIIASRSGMQDHWCQDIWLWLNPEGVVNHRYRLATGETSRFKFDNSVPHECHASQPFDENRKPPNYVLDARKNGARL